MNPDPIEDKTAAPAEEAAPTEEVSPLAEHAPEATWKKVLMENPMDGGAWQSTVHQVTKGFDMT